MVLGLCRLLLRDHHEAEDAAQQTFVSAYRSLLRGTEPREPGPWLAAIARNECRARLRRRAKAPLALDGEVELELADTSDLAELADQRAELSQLASEIAKLPSRQREALALRDFLGLSYEEVASTLSVSVPVVESLLFRARRRLRDTVRTVPRYAAGIVIVPFALRAAVARDVPDFDAISVGLGFAGVAGAAAGGVAKLLSVPASVKVAATVAVVATGSVVAPKLMTPSHQSAAPAAVVQSAEPKADAAANSDPAAPEGVPDPPREQQAPAAEPTPSSNGGDSTPSATTDAAESSAPSGEQSEPAVADVDPGRINSSIVGSPPELTPPPAPGFTGDCGSPEPTVTADDGGQGHGAWAAAQDDPAASECPVGTVEPGTSGEPVPADEPAEPAPDEGATDPAQPQEPDTASPDPATVPSPTPPAAPADPSAAPADGSELPMKGDTTVSTVSDDSSLPR